MPCCGMDAFFSAPGISPVPFQMISDSASSCLTTDSHGGQSLAPPPGPPPGPTSPREQQASPSPSPPGSPVVKPSTAPPASPGPSNGTTEQPAPPGVPAGPSPGTGQQPSSPGNSSGPWRPTEEPDEPPGPSLTPGSTGAPSPTSVPPSDDSQSLFDNGTLVYPIPRSRRASRFAPDLSFLTTTFLQCY
jgi:hypothetical protein